MISKLDWDGIRVFLTVARAGSLSGAARLLGSNQPTVGRYVDRLERTLGTCLFLRHVRGLTLTDDAHRLLEIAENMENAALGMEGFNDGFLSIKGVVRVAVPEGLASYIIAPQLEKLLCDAPELSIELLVSSHFSDLTRGEADIALRLNQPTTLDLVIRKLGRMHFNLYTSANHAPGNINEKRIIAYGDRLAHLEENRWLYDTFCGANVTLKSDHTTSRVQATMAGLGLAVLPTFIGDPATGLIRHASPRPLPAGHDIWMVVHDNLRHLPRIRVTMNFLAKCVQDALAC